MRVVSSRAGLRYSVLRTEFECVSYVDAQEWKRETRSSIGYTGSTSGWYLMRARSSSDSKRHTANLEGSV
jgi:hypothetical protein